MMRIQIVLESVEVPDDGVTDEEHLDLKALERAGVVARHVQNAWPSFRLVKVRREHSYMHDIAETPTVEKVKA